jgi:hypothetical protein
MSQIFYHTRCHKTLFFFHLYFKIQYSNFKFKLLVMFIYIYREGIIVNTPDFISFYVKWPKIYALKLIN